MTADELLMQLQADVLGLPVVRPAVGETTALGAAFAAGLAVGAWQDRDALARRFAPMAARAAARRGSRSTYAARREAERSLAGTQAS